MSTPTTTIATPTRDQRSVLLLPAAAWVQMGVVTVLLVLLFWPNLRRLWLKTNPITGVEWDDWSHAIIVPVIGLYYLWLRRDDLLAAPVVPLLADGSSKRRWLGGVMCLAGGLLCWQVFALDVVANGMASLPAVGNLGPYLSSAGLGASVLGALVLVLDWGLGTLVGGMLLFGYGIWPGQNDYLKDLGMVMTLFGVVLTLTGWRVMAIAWFPIVFLICAIPWPGLVYTKVAIPLQFVAAKVAVIVLNLAQVDSLVEGTRIVIDLPGGKTRVLNVAEACAGMRSLMTFVTLGAAIAFLSLARPLWQKLIIVASAVPIAIICNVARVSGVGLLDVYVTEEASQGFAHTFVGLVLLAPALLMLLGVGWVLDHLLIEVGDDETQAAFSEGAGESEAHS